MSRCFDHLGNEYAALTKMAEAYGLEKCVLKTRLARGWDLRSALTMSPQGRRSGECSDHLGNRYPDLKSMANAYGINYKTFRNRLSRGWDLRQALTTPIRPCPIDACYDHLGNEYPSRRALAEAYGIDEYILKNRLRSGMSLEDALSQPNLHAVKDHLGKIYPSRKAMLAAYGISRSTFAERIDSGCSLKDALTAKPGTFGREVRDYRGKAFPTLAAMLEAYKVPKSTYLFRKRNGWTEKECLLGRKKKKSRPSKSEIIESKKRLKSAENKAFHHLELKEDPNT